MCQQELLFCDFEKIIPLIARDNKTMIKQLEGPLAIFIKLNNSINQMGSFDQLHSDPFYLLRKILDKLLNFDDSSENIVIFTPKNEKI